MNYKRVFNVSIEKLSRNQNYRFITILRNVKRNLKLIEEVNKLNFALALKNARRCIREIAKTDRKKMLLICLLVFTSFFVGLVGAVVYNSMYMQGSIGTTTSFIFSLEQVLMFT